MPALTATGSAALAGAAARSMRARRDAATIFISASYAAFSHFARSLFRLILRSPQALACGRLEGEAAPRPDPALSFTALGLCFETDRSAATAALRFSSA